MNDKFEQNDIYNRYLENGINNFNTKELLELIDILYSVGKYNELIDVAEYTISLIDMGISNDFSAEDINDWINNGIDEFNEDYNVEYLESPEYPEPINEQLPNDEDELDDEERVEDKIDSLKEYLLKLIIECALKVGCHDKVYQTINFILERTDIREADLYNDVALIGMGAGDYPFAIKFFKKIANDHIHKVAAINNMALCYESAREVAKGVQLLQEHLDNDPYDNITWINLGNLLARNNELNEALNAFDIAFAIDDTNIACLKNIARVYKVKGNLNKALKYLDEAEKLDPNDYEILIIKAECYLLMNKPKKAAHLFKTVIDEFPDRAELYHSLSVAYILDGQTEKGYRAAVKSWELAPDNHFFKSFVAKILGEDKGLRAQADKLNMELLRESQDPHIHMIVAQYYLNANNPNKALKIALNVKENQPDFHHLHLFLSRCYAVLGNYDAAQQEFDLETDEPAKQEFYNTLNNAKSN